MTYEVSFDLSGNPEGGPAYKTVRVSVGSFTHDYTVDSSGQTRSTLIWHPVSFSFVASGTSATLSFTSLNSGAYGPLLDHVMVSPVPEPAGYLLGTALVGAIAVLHFSRRVRAALLPSH